VKTDIAPGTGIEQKGWLTDIPGAKIDLQQIAQYNLNKQGGNKGPGRKEYDRLYFTTASGTIYCLINAEDGIWELEASNRPQINRIQGAATLEVGQRFQSPHLTNGQPELDTSPVQRIILLDRDMKIKDFGVSFSREEIEIGTQFVQAVQARGGKVR
jgi:hypothetical protein